MLKTILCLIPAIAAVHLTTKVHNKQTTKLFATGSACDAWNTKRARQYECSGEGLDSVVCRMFAIFDEDQSGDVTREELDNVIDTIQECIRETNPGYSVPEPELDRIYTEFDKADASHDGVVDTDEFLNYIHNPENQRALGLMQVQMRINAQCDENSPEIAYVFNSLGADYASNCIVEDDLVGAYTTMYENAGVDPEVIEEEYLPYIRQEYADTDADSNGCVTRAELAAQLC